MKLYLIRPINPNRNPWDPWYDKAFGFVVRADNESEARAMVGEEAGDEIRKAPDAWANPQYSSCVELTAEGEAEVVIRDFHAA